MRRPGSQDTKRNGPVPIGARLKRDVRKSSFSYRWRGRIGISQADRAGAYGNRYTTRTVLSSGVSDRKSTRLNSSHTVISYAVFCLKKKKKQRKDTNQH